MAENTENTYKPIAKIKQEVLQSILDKSAFGLPDSPRDRKMSPAQVKAAFYKPVVDGTNSMSSEINRVIDDVNTEFQDVRDAHVVLQGRVKSNEDDIETTKKDMVGLTIVDARIEGKIDTHVANNENPHGVTAAQLGLGDVDNTSDADKPVSTAQKEYVDDKIAEDIKTAIDNLNIDKYKLVDSLPDPGLEGIMYLVPIAGEVDKYRRYIWEGSEWIDLGDTAMKLDDYYTKIDINGFLDLKADASSVYTKQTIDTKMTTLQNNVNAELDGMREDISAGQGTILEVAGVSQSRVSFKSDPQGQMDALDAKFNVIEAMQLEGEGLAIDTNGGAIDDLVVGMNSRQAVSLNVLPVTELYNGDENVIVDNSKKEMGIYTISGAFTHIQANPRLIDFFPVSDSVQTVRVEIMGGITTAVTSRFEVYKNGITYGAVKLNSGLGGVMTIPANTSVGFYIMNGTELCGFTDYTFRIEVVKGNYTFENYPIYQPYTGQPAIDNPIRIEDFGSVVNLGAHGVNLLKYQLDDSVTLQYPTDVTRNFMFRLPQRQSIDAGVHTIEIVYTNRNLSTYMFGSLVFYDSQQNGVKLPEIPLTFNFGDRLFTTFSINKGCYLDNIYVSLLPKDIQSITVTNFQILKGSYTLDTLPSYQPYQFHSATINLTDTAGVTHTARSVGTARNEIMKQNGKWWFKEEIAGIVFDGSADERWSVRTINPTDVVAFDIPNAGGYDYSSAISNWFGERKADYVGNYEHFYTSDATMYIFIAKSRGITTVEQLRNYLAINNLTVNYQLAIPIIYELATTESAKLDEFLSATYSPKTYISVTNDASDNPIAGYLKLTDVIDENATCVQPKVGGENVVFPTHADYVRNKATGRTVDRDIAILNNKTDSCTSNLVQHAALLDLIQESIAGLGSDKANTSGDYPDITAGKAITSVTQNIDNSTINIATTEFVHNLINSKLSFKLGTMSMLSGISSYNLRKQGNVVLLNFKIDVNIPLSKTNWQKNSTTGFYTHSSVLGVLPSGFYQVNKNIKIPYTKKKYVFRYQPGTLTPVDTADIWLRVKDNAVEIYGESDMTANTYIFDVNYDTYDDWNEDIFAYWVLGE